MLWEGEPEKMLFLFATLKEKLSIYYIQDYSKKKKVWNCYLDENCYQQ